MIGYHYTTRERWETSIRHHGLFPHAIRQHELDRFRKAVPLMPNEAIWVWRYRLEPRNAWIASLLLTELHDDFDLVLLEVNYGLADAVSLNFKEREDDTVNLNCSFSAGRLDTGDQPIELLFRHIPPEQLKVVWRANLLDTFKTKRAAPFTGCGSVTGEPGSRYFVRRIPRLRSRVAR